VKVEQRAVVFFSERRAGAPQRRTLTIHVSVSVQSDIDDLRVLDFSGHRGNDLCCFVFAAKVEQTLRLDFHQAATQFVVGRSRQRGECIVDDHEADLGLTEIRASARGDEHELDLLCEVKGRGIGGVDDLDGLFRMAKTAFGISFHSSQRRIATHTTNSAHLAQGLLVATRRIGGKRSCLTHNVNAACACDGSLRMLVGSLGIKIDQLAGHHQVTGDDVTIGARQSGQSAQGIAVQFICADASRNRRLIAVRRNVLVRRRVVLVSTVVARRAPTSAVPEATAAVIARTEVTTIVITTLETATITITAVITETTTAVIATLVAPTIPAALITETTTITITAEATALTTVLKIPATIVATLVAPAIPAALITRTEVTTIVITTLETTTITITTVITETTPTIITAEATALTTVLKIPATIVATLVAPAIPAALITRTEVTTIVITTLETTTITITTVITETTPTIITAEATALTTLRAFAVAVAPLRLTLLVSTTAEFAASSSLFCHGVYPLFLRRLARSCSWCASCAFNHPIVDDGRLISGMGPQKREGRHALAVRPSR
ncbi:MAG: hypothetical protein ACLR2J_10610, partial [Actinomyces sp.]